MVVEGWRGGGDAALGKILAGLLPHGLISTRQIEAMVARRVPEWPLHSRLWVVAVDYESGATLWLSPMISSVRATGHMRLYFLAIFSEFRFQFIEGTCVLLVTMLNIVIRHVNCRSGNRNEANKALSV